VKIEPELWDAQPGWLNTASYGLPPRAAFQEMQIALDDWRHGRVSWEGWDDSTGRARAAFAALLGVPAGDIAVGSTAAGLVGTIAASLPAGAKVVVPEIEFTSNLFPWLVQLDRGVQVETVPLDKLVEAVDARTSVVAVSAVQSSTGEVVPFDELAEAAHAVGAHFVVDASQAAGWLPLNWKNADAVVVSGYKWLMSPRGTAYAYLSPRLRETLRPINASWYAAEDVHTGYYGPEMRLAADARRFDVSPAWFSWVGAAPTVELLVELGVEQIHEHNVGLANRFRAGLGLPPGDSAIVSTDVPGADERLAAAGIRAAVRDGRLRVSFHAYTTTADVDRALEALTAR
jgi:selenocysteine lyase/cysteine desulfurase